MKNPIEKLIGNHVETILAASPEHPSAYEIARAEYGVSELYSKFAPEKVPEFEALLATLFGKSVGLPMLLRALEPFLVAAYGDGIISERTRVVEHFNKAARQARVSGDPARSAALMVESMKLLASLSQEADERELMQQKADEAEGILRTRTKEGS